MAELKMEICYAFFYRDLEKLVQEVYGSMWDIMESIPWELRGQNTYHEVTVDGESELCSIGDPEIVEEWIKTGETHMLDMSEYAEFDYAGGKYQNVEMHHALHRLFNDGIIPPGKYLMTVWW